MNKKNFFLSLITIFTLATPLQTMAMFSKPKFDKNKEYTEEQMYATERFAQEIYNKKPNLEYISRLIKQGADVNIQDDSGLSLLYVAAFRNDLPLVRLLITHGAVVDLKDNNKNTPLDIACEEGHIKMISLLVENGANVNNKNNIYNSPLNRACEFNHLEVVKFLVNHGASINAGDGAVLNPLHTACTQGFFEIVKFLITKGADINAKNYKHATPLHFACMAKKTDNIIDLLIKKGADLNAVIKDFKWTPLHVAVAVNNISACMLLLNAGANPLAQTIDGLTPLDFAYDLNYRKIIPLFRTHGVQTQAEKQAYQNMLAFFTELNREEISKKKKFAKKTNQRPQPSVEITPPINPLTEEPFPAPIADELFIDELPEELVIEPITEEEVVIETPSTASPAARPIVAKPFQEKAIIAQKIISSHHAPAIAHQNDVYQILIGQNLKWPHLNKTQEQLIKDNLLSLKNWPTHKLDIKQLKGEVNLYRLRVGNYRIIFSVDTIHREIKVQKIGLRKEIYKQYKS